jgi:hypothetical protein
VKKIKSTVTHLAGTNGSKPHGQHKSTYVVTAASTRSRDPVARMPHGKVDVRSGTARITGKTGLPKVRGC